MSKPLYIDVIFTGVKHRAIGTSAYVLYVGRATIIWHDGIRTNALIQVKAPDNNTAMDKIKEYCIEYARQGVDADENDILTYNGHVFEGVEIDAFDDYVYNYHDIPHYINYDNVLTHVELDARTDMTDSNVWY